MMRQLGKLSPRIDKRTLQLRRYLGAGMKEAPVECFWQTAVDKWAVGGNDQYGNCVIVTAAHELQNWRANERGDSRPISDAAIIELSREMGALDGYVILDRLNWWRKRGMWGSTIWAYAQIAAHDEPLFMHAIESFGMVDIGLSLPSAWRNQDIWDVGIGRAYKPNSWGGHSVPLVGYDKEHVYCVTWGELQQITWRGLQAYCDEAYAVISPDWLTDHGHTPSGYDLGSLRHDLTAVQRQE